MERYYNLSRKVRLSRVAFLVVAGSGRGERRDVFVPSRRKNRRRNQMLLLVAVGVSLTDPSKNISKNKIRFARKTKYI